VAYDLGLPPPTSYAGGGEDNESVASVSTLPEYGADIGALVESGPLVDPANLFD
jgi:hypothetical protein